MPQSDGVNKLKRMEFEFKGNIFKFSLNPEEFSIEEPSRTTVTQTKGGAWIDYFGGGLRNIFIKGSTGMKNGYSKFVELRTLLRDYYNNVSPGDTVFDELIFHNYTDDESYIVHIDPSGFKLFRSKSNPLLYMYEIRMIVLRLASEPAPGTESKTVISTDNSEPEVNVMTEVFGEEAVPNSQLSAYTNGIQILNNGTVQINETSEINGGSPIVYSLAMDYNDTYTETLVDSVKPTLNLHVSNITLDLYKGFIEGTVQTSSKEFKSGSFMDKVVNEIPKSTLNINVKDTIKFVILDIFSIYRAYKKDRDSFLKRVSGNDIKLISRNIYWVINELGNYDDPNFYDLIETLHQILLELGEIKNYSPLFEQSISKSLENYNLARR